MKQKVEPRGFAAVSRNFSSGGGSWDYIMGDVVSSTKDQPEELIIYTIPTGTYAVCRIAPRAKFLWGPAIGLTKKYVYTEWIQSSEYELNPEEIRDFEFHDKRSVSDNPMIELSVSIKKK